MRAYKEPRSNSIQNDGIPKAPAVQEGVPCRQPSHKCVTGLLGSKLPEFTTMVLEFASEPVVGGGVDPPPFENSNDPMSSAGPWGLATPSKSLVTTERFAPRLIAGEVSWR